MSEINLILKKRKEEGMGSKKILEILRIASGVSLVLTLIFSVGIFFIKINSPLPSLKDEEKKLLTSLSSSKQKVAKTAILSDRLKTISEILSKRVDFENLINSTTKDDSGNIQVKTLAVDKKAVLITVYSPSLKSVSALVDNLASMVSNKKTFRKITVTELTADAILGVYSLSINADLL